METVSCREEIEQKGGGIWKRYFSIITTLLWKNAKNRRRPCCKSRTYVENAAETDGHTVKHGLGHDFLYTLVEAESFETAKRCNTALDSECTYHGILAAVVARFPRIDPDYIGHSITDGANRAKRTGGDA